MEKRNIIVIGASAGGFEAIRKLISGLPSDLDAAVFIVWHMSPEVLGVLPQVINKDKKLTAVHATNDEPIRMGRVYIAPPDHHMLLENEKIRVTKGPKENRFRPAIDPLFRSAAYTYGPRVIGVILTGSLDDGTAGLWTIKEYGGLAVAQDPADAEVPSMPENAIRNVSVDYVVPLAAIAGLLEKLSNEKVAENSHVNMEENEKNKMELDIAAQRDIGPDSLMKYGTPSMYTCPECHGVLSAFREGKLIRFRCHTGHAFSPDSLLAALTETIEDSFWNTIRSVQESVILLNSIGDHFAEINQPKVAALYFKKAKEADAQVELVRQIVFRHEQLTKENIEQQTNRQD